MTAQIIPEQAWTDEEVAQHFEVLKVHLILLTKRFRNAPSGYSSFTMHLRTIVRSVTRFEIPTGQHIVFSLH